MLFFGVLNIPLFKYFCDIPTYNFLLDESLSNTYLLKNYFLNSTFDFFLYDIEFNFFFLDFVVNNFFYKMNYLNNFEYEHYKQNNFLSYLNYKK